MASLFKQQHSFRKHPELVSSFAGLQAEENELTEHLTVKRHNKRRPRKYSNVDKAEPSLKFRKQKS